VQTSTLKRNEKRKMQPKTLLTCSSYLGPTCYYSALLHAEQVSIEGFENYLKQTLRNRCTILGPNGPQMLNIPVLKQSGKQHMKDVKISYAEDWQKNHWKSIQTAYGSSAFYEVLSPDLEPFYFKQETYLIDFNWKLMELVFNWLQIKPQLKITEAFSPISDLENDHRFAYNKKDLSHFQANKYFQINADQKTFYPNLSIIDLVFNQGPMAWEILNLEAV
jgi:hypothetical protein